MLCNITLCPVRPYANSSPQVSSFDPKTSIFVVCLRQSLYGALASLELEILLLGITGMYHHAPQKALFLKYM